VVREKEGEIRYEVPYDKLVIAVGCYSASLGIEGVSISYPSLSPMLISGGQIRSFPQRYSRCKSHSNANAVGPPSLMLLNPTDEEGRYSK
jgi:NADPH-dependent 2,4-dienoyl-CoA reductase/sulfur reductase-like enzyme